MHFTSPGGNLCLSVGFTYSAVSGKNSLYYVSAVFFPSLLSIHHIISVLCTVVHSPHPCSTGFIPIFQMHLLLTPFHRTCQPIPMCCLLFLSSPDQPFGSGTALHSHPAWHNGHLIYVYTSYSTAVWFRYLNTLWQPQHCLGRLKAPHQCINTPRQLYTLSKCPALHPQQRKGVGKKNLHLPTERVILAKHMGGIKLIILSCFVSRNILPSTNILVSLYQVDTGSEIPKSTRKIDSYINNACL